MDPITTPLLILVFGNLANELIENACKDYLKDKFKLIFTWLETIGERDKVEIAYQDVMEQAYGACLEMLLLNIKGFGYSDNELKEYQFSIARFIRDKKVAEELLKSVREPNRSDHPSPEILQQRWEQIGGLELPSETLWQAVSSAFRRQAAKRVVLSDELRAILNAQNLQQLRELIERQGGVKTQVRLDKYSQRMRTKFSPIDLANLMPAYADDPGRMVLSDVFVAQDVRENPPRVEIPKDIAQKLEESCYSEADNNIDVVLDKHQLAQLHTNYISQSPLPILDTIAAKNNRLLVLTGDPGSGKSTLMRYLLTSIIQISCNAQPNSRLPWMHDLEKHTFPLLIELRDFYALRQSNECDSFLEYVAYMGKTDQWFLDDHSVNSYLESGSSIVMFDGLDEIFDAADRQRIMHEIVGFSLRYERAKIVVTSRPVGYRDRIFRDANFKHFGIQDLSNQQIEAFVQGWFSLTFPQQPQQSQQRIDRVINSVTGSKSIRLLAGNPMLLTIMSLLAREEELPRERSQFYEKAVEVLCHHWDVNRHLELPDDRYRLNASDKKLLLQQVAMQMQSGKESLKGNVITEKDLEQEIQNFLLKEHWQPNAVEAKRATRRIILQLRERNYILCIRGANLYGFVHRTFLEYLTAAEYVKRFDRQPQQMTIAELISLFERNHAHDEWREVLRLICGQIDEQFVGQIVRHLSTRFTQSYWDGNTPLPEVVLAVLCLGESRSFHKSRADVQVLLDSIIQLIVESEGGIPEEDANGYGYPTIYSFLMDDLLPAVESFGDRWPRKQYLADHSVEFVSKLRGGGVSVWGQFIATVTNDREAVKNLTVCNRFLVRRAAIDELAKRWPDEATLTHLRFIANSDINGYPRAAAIKSIVKISNSQTTREFIVQRCSEDDIHWIRRVAMQVMAETWQDDSTRSFLEDRVMQENESDPRAQAISLIASYWHDDSVRHLLEDRAVNDPDGYPRSQAISSLAEHWRDDSTRRLLEDRAVNDPDASFRGQAINSLAKHWHDDSTRRLLEDRAVNDPDASFRGQAVGSLTKYWYDDSTRCLLEDRAVNDPDASFRSRAISLLEKHWQSSVN